MSHSLTGTRVRIQVYTKYYSWYDCHKHECFPVRSHLSAVHTHKVQLAAIDATTAGIDATAAGTDATATGTDDTATGMDASGAGICATAAYAMPQQQIK